MTGDNVVPFPTKPAPARTRVDILFDRITAAIEAGEKDYQNDLENVLTHAELVELAGRLKAYAAEASTDAERRMRMAELAFERAGGDLNMPISEIADQPPKPEGPAV